MDGQTLAEPVVMSPMAMPDFPPTPHAAAPTWPDTPAARAQVAALLRTLNADLLSHDSATLTLERWCADHGMAPARVTAQRVEGPDKAIPSDLRDMLELNPRETLSYRRVLLTCGDFVLSEADNWYVPQRLSTAMNTLLDESDMPFGKVVHALGFHRETLGAEMLWSPLDAGAITGDEGKSQAAGTLAIPRDLLRHCALLSDATERPFSVLIETYTHQVLAFSPVS